MLNRVVLLGRIAADLELRNTPNGVPVMSFPIAVDRPYTKGAEKQADFIDIVTWRNTAEFVSKYFQKGSPIVVEGRIETRTYNDKNGERRKRVEVVADNVSFVPTVRSDSQPSKAMAQEPAYPQFENNSTYSSGSTGDFKELEDEEDLPF